MELSKMEILSFFRENIKGNIIDAYLYSFGTEYSFGTDNQDKEYVWVSSKNTLESD